jgi:hypothetical protein
MPLTAKGEEIYQSLLKTYGSERKAKQVLYAGKNAGTFTGIDDNTVQDRLDAAVCLTDALEERMDAYCERMDAVNTNEFANLRTPRGDAFPPYTILELQRLASELRSGPAT